jgi:hypothetical protein
MSSVSHATAPDRDTVLVAAGAPRLAPSRLLARTYATRTRRAQQPPLYLAIKARPPLAGRPCAAVPPGETGGCERARVRTAEHGAATRTYVRTYVRPSTWTYLARRPCVRAINRRASVRFHWRIRQRPPRIVTLASSQRLLRRLLVLDRFSYGTYRRTPRGVGKAALHSMSSPACPPFATLALRTTPVRYRPKHLGNLAPGERHR